MALNIEPAEKQFKWAMRRHKFGKVIRIFIMSSFVMSVCITMYLGYLLACFYLDDDRWFIYFFAMFDFLFLGIATVASYLFLPMLILLPTFLILMETWGNPPSIVVLRPFFRSDASKALRRLARLGLSGLGLIFTLSDQHIKQKWYFKYPISHIHLSFLQYGIRRIKNYDQVDKLRDAMSQPWRRIFNWTLSPSKIFPIACTDEYWQYAINRLLPVADLILVDLTGSKDNVVWEIQECEFQGLLDRVIFIQHVGDSNRVSRVIIKGEVTTTYEAVQYGRVNKQELREIMRLMLSKLSASAPRTPPLADVNPMLFRSLLLLRGGYTEGERCEVQIEDDTCKGEEFKLETTSTVAR